MRQKTLAERIRWLRAKLGLSQKEFANLVGKSLRTVQRWESGEVTIPKSVLRHIANTTGVSLEWLETGKGSPFKQEPNPEAPLDVELLNFITKKVLEAYEKGLIPREVDEYFLLDLIKLAYRKLKPLKDKKEKEIAVKELEKLLLLGTGG